MVSCPVYVHTTECQFAEVKIAFCVLVSLPNCGLSSLQIASSNIVNLRIDFGHVAASPLFYLYATSYFYCHLFKITMTNHEVFLSKSYLVIEENHVGCMQKQEKETVIKAC